MTHLAAGPTCAGRPTGTPTGQFADPRIYRGSSAPEAGNIDLTEDAEGSAGAGQRLAEGATVA